MLERRLGCYLLAVFSMLSAHACVVGNVCGIETTVECAFHIGVVGTNNLEAVFSE